nr:hypothetical protein [uncultured Caproiciproducens sp.]
MAQTLATVFKLTDQYTATMQKIIQASDAYEKKQQQAQKATDQFKASMKGINSNSTAAVTGIGAVTAKITGLVSAAYLGKKAVDLLFTAVKAGATQQLQKNTFEALLSNDKAGTALFNYVNTYAKTSALGAQDLSSATTSFLAFTRDINQIDQLNKLTERLYAKDPNQGAEGAVFAIKEILTGQTMSLKNRFNMNGVSAEKIQKLSEKGDIAGTINYLDQVFNRFGATQSVVDKNFNSLTMSAQRFKTNFVQGMAGEASPTVQNLSLLMKQLNDDMSAGKFQPFFSLVANGSLAIGNAMSWVAQNANVLVPIIGGVVSAIVVYNAAMGLARLYTLTTGAAISAVAGNWIGAAVLIAGAAATIGIATSLNSQNNDLKKNVLTLAQAKNDYTKSLDNAHISAKVPVEVSNKSPISVKGQVEIEKESQKYLFDLAAQKAIANFSMVNNTPSVIIQNQNVSKTADLGEINQALGDMVYQNSGTQPQGVYP